MNLNLHFDHFNINVSDIDRSIAFYQKAIGLEVCGEKKAADGSFIIKYMKFPDQDFRLELTWLRDHPQAYDLGENESHLAFRTSGDYEEVKKYHRDLGVICFENPSMGIYFINDPDDYWIEIIPPKKV